MNGLIASLEAKYDKGASRRGKGKREPSVAPEEPSEEEFAAARSVVIVAASRLCRPSVATT